MKKIILLLVIIFCFYNLKVFARELVSEDFNSIEEWEKWGNPQPAVLSEVHGYQNVFDNRGDGWCTSGIISLNSYNFFSKKITIEADVYLEVNDYSGCWVGPKIGISNGQEITSGDCAQDGYKDYLIAMYMEGDACWGTPSDKRRHTYLRGSLGIGRDYSINVDNKVNKWVKLKMEIDRDGYIKAYIDNQLLAISEEPVPENVLQNAYIIIGGRSSGYGGKAYIDNLKVYEESESIDNDRYNEGFEAGKEYCKNNPSQCGITDRYEEGIEAGKEFCKNDPTACGIIIDCNNDEDTSNNCEASFNMFTNTLHIPCLRMGESYWLDLSLIASDPVQLQMTDFGTN